MLGDAVGGADSRRRLELDAAISSPRSAARSPVPARMLPPRPMPLFGRRDDLLLPDVFAQHQQTVPRLEEGRHVEEGADPLCVEPPDAGIEVDEPHGDAGHAHDRQAGGLAFVLDQPLLLDVDVQRIGEDVDRVEAISRSRGCRTPSPDRPAPRPTDQGRASSIPPFAVIPPLLWPAPDAPLLVWLGGRPTCAPAACIGYADRELHDLAPGCRPGPRWCRRAPGRSRSGSTGPTWSPGRSAGG